MKIAAVSDLHGYLPDIPECDLLLIAGDICPDTPRNGKGQAEWWRTYFKGWLEGQPVGEAYMTWGNHDRLPDGLFPRVKVDEMVEIPYEDGILKIWFSPWSNLFGSWAWMQEPEALKGVYDAIPPCDILVSHQPPYGYGDVAAPGYGCTPGHLGSMELRDRLDTLQPDILLCGHIHGGYGTYTHGRTTIHNVARVDEAYRPVNPITVFEF